MNAVRNSYGYVLKSIKKDRTLRPIVENLKGQTFVVSGASRGIGFNIAEKLVKSGANVTILGKTTKEHPKLEGTIYSAADHLNNMDAELLEFVVSEDSRVLGKKIKDLEISRTATIGGVIRAGEGIIALGDFEIKPGDRVLVCCLPKSISRVERLFR